MKFKRILAAIVSVIVIILGYSLHHFIKTKKTHFLSNGGFDRNYLPIQSELKLVAPSLETLYRFSHSNNTNFTIGHCDKSLVKITYENDLLEFTPIRNIPVFANSEYFSDDTNENIYILNKNNLITTRVKLFPGFSKRIISKNEQLGQGIEPVIFSDNKLICVRATNKKWHFQFQHNKLLSKNKMTLIKLVDQGSIKHFTLNNTFIYVSLFSNEIIQFDSTFNVICQAKTIDTIRLKPKTKEINNSLVFSSPPRVSNYDFFISKNQLFIRSIVKSNREIDFKKKIVFDIYDINKKFKYVGSFFLEHPNEDYPTDMHLLNNNNLLLLYENRIEVFNIKI
ncbi:hypothetical protein EWU23_08645 [Cytophagaceae bacterium 50C-KIRBA]|uniref:DUF4221 domain-containing protein n=1 Tax=Aquirufa beregesia TaxID=2516556 RepID=A0ABX0EYG4_9BACT|nr:hypothetical protein [Aquirufa beregesia]NGZ44542.1 hypothetical protein [Aquirufa beregesia]